MPTRMLTLPDSNTKGHVHAIANTYSDYDAGGIA